MGEPQLYPAFMHLFSAEEMPVEQGEEPNYVIGPMDEPQPALSGAAVQVASLHWCVAWAHEPLIDSYHTRSPFGRSLSCQRRDEGLRSLSVCGIRFLPWIWSAYIHWWG